MLKPKKDVKISKKELKEDKFVLAVFKAKDFLEAHAKEIMYGVIAVVAVVLIVSFYNSSRKKAEESANVMLSEAQVLLSQGQEDDGIARLNDLADRYEGTDAAGYATFLLAKHYLDKGDTVKAKSFFKKYIDDYGNDKMLLQAAMVGYADCLVMEKNYEEAARYYERAARINPDFPEVPAYIFSAAMAYKQAGNVDKARKLFKEIVEKYERSPYKAQSEIFLKYLEMKVS